MCSKNSKKYYSKNIFTTFGIQQIKFVNDVTVSIFSTALKFCVANNMPLKYLSMVLIVFLKTRCWPFKKRIYLLLISFFVKHL